MLQLDQKARKKQVRRLLKRKNRKVAVSDTEMRWRLEKFETEGLEKGLKEIVLKAQERGLMKVKLPGGKKVKIGSIDGTEFGIFKRSCFQMLGEVNLFMAMKKIEKRGKELPTSKALLKELKEELGKGFVDYLLTDALYANQPHIDLCTEELGVHSIVKITEKGGKEIRLDIIKDAKRIFARYEETGGKVEGVEYIKGIDSDRLVQYETWTVGDLYNLGTKKPK